MKSILLSLLFSTQIHAACKIINSQGEVVTSPTDAVFNILNSNLSCPQDIYQFKNAVHHDGLKTKNTMVANRGHHNPKFGSFSFFEMASGFSKSSQKTVNSNEFFFGHFTKAESNVVVLDQTGRLMIELIAWDPKKKMYNFYELIRGRNSNTWFYRGDSKDALLDNQNLHLQDDPSSPVFGSRMRCSGCHTSGGPIMKELEAPHNAWWTKDNTLPFSPNQPSDEILAWLDETVDASALSEAVSTGIDKLNTSPNYKSWKKKLSLKEQLRPLFCTTEINLVSDQIPLGKKSDVMTLSTTPWVNPLLLQSEITLIKSNYIEALEEMNFSFPETDELDANHGWLAPVKGTSDIKAIQELVKSGLIDDEFVADVLMVDFENPLFSKSRCTLLRYLPTKQTRNWKTLFVNALKSKNDTPSIELLFNLTDRNQTKRKHSNIAREYIQNLQLKLKTKSGLFDELTELQKIRGSVYDSEISKNPRGQILEPGFRVIFAKPKI